MLNSQHRSNKKNNAIPSGIAYYFFCCRRAERQPTLRCASTIFFYAISLWRSHRQYGLFFYAVSFQSVNSKACGSMAERTATKMRKQRYCGKPTHKSHQKTATINTAPTHKAIIYVASAFGLSHLPQRLVAKHFLLHFIFYHN